MNRSKTVDVYVKLPHGILVGREGYGMTRDGTQIAMDSTRMHLTQGVTTNVPRRYIEKWLADNRNLAAVRRGDVRILDDDRMAIDSSGSK